ncbi:MAG: ATP-binding protein [Lachnospiraceae bacterium]|nr:ATP-binding protein [Lachnospiraceae bacterium]
MDLLFNGQYDLLGYFVEIILAELLFLHQCEKRSHFLLTFGCSTFAGAVISLLLGIPWGMNSTLIKFVLLLFVILMSVVVMRISFLGGPQFIISSSIAGVATQHIAYKTRNLLEVLLFHKSDSVRLVEFLIMEVAVIIVVFALVYILFAKNYKSASTDFRSNIISIVIVLTCIGVNRLVADHPLDNYYYETATDIYAIICCFFSLAAQFYIYKWYKEQTDAIIIKNLLAASEKQYEQWKSMEEFTSIKIHDLKHLLDRIERLSGEENISIPNLDSIRKTIDGFKPNVKTGNEVIDILLRNMVVLCLQQDIRFNVVSFTDMLGNFDSMSLYFLIANAIDNAREAVEKVEEKDKRIIDISIKQFGSSVVIHLWNYFDGTVKFKDNLPVSLKAQEGHGYGLKSIKTIVDTFEGAMSTEVDGDCFHLNIILPIHNVKKETKNDETGICP